jgi:DNA polymerase-1
MVSTKRPLFCLIDASSFIFRAYYAVRPLSNKQGLPTNAVFGFAQMILSVLEDMKPTHIAFVYDTKHPSFRKEMYAEYKANRSSMPEDLVPQMPYIKKFVELLGLPGFELAGFEADDIIATFAERAAHLSGGEAEVCIVSSDKDLMQLVNGHIYLYDTMKSQKYTAKEVKEKLGVPPELVADYLGIVGDSSDNIPGVKGIGPKGAVGLLEQFGSLEGIYKDLAAVKKEGARKALAECKELALLSKELATVKRDVDIKTDWHSLRCEPKPGEDFFALLDELEFGAIAKRVRGMGAKAQESSGAPVETNSEAHSAVVAGDLVAARKGKYELVCSLSQLEAAFKKHAKAEFVALDTETTSLAAHDAPIVGFSFCADGRDAYYVPLFHVNPQSGEKLTEQAPAKEALAALKDFLQGKKLIGQNLKFDLNIFRASGIEFADEQVSFDTMIASYVLEPEARHGMDLLAAKHLGHKNISFEELCGSGKEQILFSHVPLERAAEYAAEDAHVTYLLFEVLGKALAATPELEKVFREIDLPLVPVLAKMEWEGVAIDVKHLQALSEEFATELASLEKKAQELAGQEFNLASPKQLAKILFEDLKLPVVKKTKTGYSTDVEVLEKLSHQHPLPALILDHRELSKLKGTYVDVLPTLVHKKSGRVHASFHQTVAATGRLSSSDPNLQNIPIRTESGKRVRQAFVATAGHSLLGADYSQVELRILASMSGDAALVKAFQEGQDIHSLTAAQIFAVNLSEVNEQQRRQAKAINFGILYGKSAFSLAEELGISRGEAAEIIKKYFERYPTIRAFLDGLMNSAKEKGYAETIFGRRRRIEGIDSKNKMILSMAERMAVNTPIQGTAADLVKLAMTKLHQELAAQGLKAKLILQVHDELVLEVPKAESEKVLALVKRCMESAGEGKILVPLTVDAGLAENWLKL